MTKGPPNAIGSRKGWPAKSRKRPAMPRAVMVSSDDPGSSDRVNQPSWLASKRSPGGPDLDRAFEDVDKGIVGRCKRVPKRTTVFDPHLEHRNRKMVECGRNHIAVGSGKDPDLNSILAPDRQGG